MWVFMLLVGEAERLQKKQRGCSKMSSFTVSEASGALGPLERWIRLLQSRGVEGRGVGHFSGESISLCDPCGYT